MTNALCDGDRWSIQDEGSLLPLLLTAQDSPYRHVFGPVPPTLISTLKLASVYPASSRSIYNNNLLSRGQGWLDGYPGQDVVDQVTGYD